MNSRIDLSQLRYVVAAADYGSFRKAAEALNVRQSTLSRSIRQLEHATSMIVFNRSSRGVVPSDSGRNVIHTARVVLEQIDSLGSSKELDASGRIGRLQVGLCTSLSTGSLRASLLDFRAKFPGFRLTTFERSSLASRRMAANEIVASWFETRKMRSSPRGTVRQATWLWISAAYSGSASQITRFRPLRLAV